MNEQKSSAETATTNQPAATGKAVKSFIIKAIKYFIVINAVLFLLSRIRHEAFTFHILLNVIIPAACAALELLVNKAKKSN